MSVNVFDKISSLGVVAVLVIDREDDAVPLAEALLSGGVTAMELTLRTEAAMGALKRIRRDVPDMVAGIGTILTNDQVAAVADAGAAFGVAPGVNERVVEKAARVGLPFAPGICTPSDIERALAFDCRVLKFFPAELSGGLPYLKAIAAPYAHLGLRYLPLGGLNVHKMADYLRASEVAAIGGSWLAKRETVAAKDWATITEQARAVIDAVKQARS